MPQAQMQIQIPESLLDVVDALYIQAMSYPDAKARRTAFEGIQRIMEAFAQAHPQEMTSHLFLSLGSIQIKLGRHEDALAAFDGAIRWGPENAVAWHLKGYTLNKLGRHEDALAAFDGAIRWGPENAVAWHLKGYTLNKLGRHKDALVAFDGAIRWGPENAVAWHLKGYTLNKLGRHEDALVACRQAIKLNPNSHYPYHQMAWVAANLNRTPKTVKNYFRQAFNRWTRHNVDAGYSFIFYEDLIRQTGSARAAQETLRRWSKQPNDFSPAA